MGKRTVPARGLSELLDAARNAKLPANREDLQRLLTSWLCEAYRIGKREGKRS